MISQYGYIKSIKRIILTETAYSFRQRFKYEPIKRIIVMALFVKKNEKISSEELSSSNFAILSNETVQKVLKHLSKKPNYASDISDKLRIEKQLIYYYIKKLEDGGIIKIINREMINGSLAKIYSLNADSFTFVVSKNWKKFNPERLIPKSLQDFVENGELNAKIIVGSPDYHGPKRQRARDLYHAIDFSLFVGSYLNTIEPKTYLDTEIRKGDLKDNLICIGGPVSNLITEKFVDNLPITFKGRDIYSKKTKKQYAEPHQGFVSKTENPFDKTKKVLVIAGKSAQGTKAAIIGLIKNPNKENFVVEGIDLDGDGRIDDVEIKE